MAADTVVIDAGKGHFIDFNCLSIYSICWYCVC